MALSRNTGSLLAVLMAVGLAACGGGGGGGESATAGSASSSSAASLAASSAASSVSSSAASSSAVSSSSAASSAAATYLEPANAATSAYTDTRLQITFDSAPTLGSSGTVRIYKASDDSLVDTISLNVFSTGSTIAPSYTAAALTTNDTQTAIPKNNTEIDKLGNGAGSALTQWRWLFYRPVTIVGNKATIRLHDGVLTPSTAYYVQIDSGVLNGTVAGSTFGGVSGKSGWTFTTRAAPGSNTAVTVDDDGDTADFRTVQGAVNWLTSKCGTAGSDSSCSGVAVTKTISIKNGSYEGEVFIRNIHNLTIEGESRDGVVVKATNFEQYNPGTGGSKTTPTTTALAEVGGNRPRLDGGRAVMLVEGADLFKLTNFTLQNSHVKNVWEGATVSLNNQAETIYFNSSSTSGSRLIATYMNFLSTQDTIQLKGWGWFYKSLIKGDVDFLWGSPYAALFEESTLHTVVDTTDATKGGYIMQSRSAYGYPGFVILKSELTADAGVPAGSTYLARSVGASKYNPSTGYCSATTPFVGTSLSGNGYFYCDTAAFIDTKMGAHVATVGWYDAPNITSSATQGYREWQSLNASGSSLDVSGRSNGLTTSDLSALNTRVKVFALWGTTDGTTATATGWNPQP